MRRRLATLATTLAVAWLACGEVAGCMWDRDSDTLRADANEVPDILRAITGRFPRYPDLYYEMRLARVSEEIASRPDALALYDDAAVACDRLHRSDEALAWMERKKAQLKKKDDPTHRYRYLANTGTFLAHRWFRNGARASDLRDIRNGRDLIEAAIELNPNAHFGRERFQLMFMDRLIDAKLDRLDNEGYIGVVHEDDLRTNKDLDEAIAGIAGLIVLGDAWRSVDVLSALTAVLHRNQRSSASYLAHLRRNEISEDGAEGILEIRTVYRGFEERKNLHSFFKDARDEANDWHVRRTTYANERMKKGEHPDTHPDFWSDFDEGKPVAIPGMANRLAYKLSFSQWLWGTAICLAATCWYFWRYLKRSSWLDR